jgi:type IV secretory pathway VirB2 component (pilin)
MCLTCLVVLATSIMGVLAGLWAIIFICLMGLLGRYKYVLIFIAVLGICICVYSAINYDTKSGYDTKSRECSTCGSP